MAEQVMYIKDWVKQKILESSPDSASMKALYEWVCIIEDLVDEIEEDGYEIVLKRVDQ